MVWDILIPAAAGLEKRMLDFVALAATVDERPDR
jgi:hypothetical protein